MGTCIGSGMSIVGNIECNGPAQVFGRIEGELRASDLLIGEGAQVEGNVLAQDVTVCGRVKGTIRAVRVKLQDGGAVDGDIFHQSLSIDENSLFEGMSRRVENPTDLPSSIDAKAPPKEDTQSPTHEDFIFERIDDAAHGARAGEDINAPDLLRPQNEQMFSGLSQSGPPRINEYTLFSAGTCWAVVGPSFSFHNRSQAPKIAWSSESSGEHETVGRTVSPRATSTKVPLVPSA